MEARLNDDEGLAADEVNEMIVLVFLGSYTPDANHLGDTITNTKQHAQEREPHDNVSAGLMTLGYRDAHNKPFDHGKAHDIHIQKHGHIK